MENPSEYIPKLIAEYIDETVDKCTPDKTIVDLDLDSIDLLTLGMEVEEYYDIAEITNEDYVSIKRIQDLIDLVLKRVPVYKYATPIK